MNQQKKFITKFKSQIQSYRLNLIIRKFYHLACQRVPSIQKLYHQMIRNLFKNNTSKLRNIFTQQITSKIRFNISTDPEPKQNNKQSENPQSTDKPTQKYTAQHRKLARIKVARSQLYKVSKAQLDYQKIHHPTKQIQTVQNFIKIRDFKMKAHKDHGSLVQFYRPQKNQTKKVQYHNKQGQQDKSGINIQIIKTIAFQNFETKIFFMGNRQIRNTELQYFDSQLREQIHQHDASLSAQNLFKPMKQFNKDFQKGFKNFGKTYEDKRKLKQISFNLTKQYSEAMKLVRQDLHKTIDKRDICPQEDFHQFIVFLRNKQNPLNKQTKKWLRVSLAVNDWGSMHLYKVDVVDDIDTQQISIQLVKDAKDRFQSTKYKGVQAHELDVQLQKYLKQFLEVDQYIDLYLLMCIYYYSGLHEHHFYKKWLEELVDFCK